MRQKFFQGIGLAKIRIFPIKDLWLFIIAVLLISITSAAVGSFVSGLKPAEFFLGEDEDVLAITPSGTATPLTGYIPISLVQDISQLNGVKAVSAEVLGVVIAQNLNDRPIIIRGITANFLNITKHENMKGEWFHQISEQKEDKITTFGAVVGVSLANDQNLDIGSKLTLISTLAPMTIELTITGLIETGTPVDSELIVPLSIAQSMTGMLTNYVSLIRVQIDPFKQTKTQIREILNGEYQIPIIVKSNDPTFETDLNKILITVFSLGGELIINQSLDKHGRTTIELPFGTYRFVASPSITVPSFVEVFVDSNISSPIILWIGKPRHNLIVNVTYNNRPAINAMVNIQDKFHPTKKYNGTIPSEGVFSFVNLTENYFDVNVSYKGFSEIKEVLLNSTKELKVAFKNSLRILIINSTNGEEIKGGAVQLLNATNPEQILYPREISDNQPSLPYNSGEVIYIEDPNTYLVNYTFRNKQRTWKQVICSNTNSTIYIGKGELLITVFGFDGEILENGNVSVILDGKIIDFRDTNTEGKVNFNLETGNHYEILIKDPQNRNKSSTLYFDSPKVTSISLKPINVYWLETRVFNGTIEKDELSGLRFCNLMLYNSTGLVNNTLTNDNGTANIAIKNPGKYFLNATYQEYNWFQEINILKEITLVEIPFGDVKVKIIARTSSNLPIANTSVKIYKEGQFLEELITNKTGEGLGIFPLGNYSFVIEKAEFREELNQSFTVSQIYTLEKVFDLAGTLSLEVTSSEGKRIGGVSVVLENVHYSITMVGITNQNSEIVFPDLPWGNYSVTVVFQEILYERLFIGFVEKEKRLTIEVTIPVKFLEETISSIKWRGQISITVIESRNFLRGFLISTLEVVTTALTALVAVITVLSLLSVSSAISYPITTNERNITMIRTIGGSDKQIFFNIAIQMTIIGLTASVVGAAIGTMIMTYTNLFKTTNIGGLFITPVVSLETILGIIISTVIVIITKTWYVLKSEFHPQRSILKGIPPPKKKN